MIVQDLCFQQINDLKFTNHKDFLFARNSDNDIYFLISFIKL